MAKFGSLEVKTFGAGKSRTWVAVLPGNEFKPEHFDPAKLDAIAKLSSRVNLFKSKVGNNHFVGKVMFPNARLGDVTPLRAVNEAKIARFANEVAKANGFHDIVVEEPLAVSFKRGEYRVFYRRFVHKFRYHGRDEHDWPITEPEPFTVKHLDRKDAFVAKLCELGLQPLDLANIFGERQYCIGEDGRIHFYDVEFWKPTEKLKKQLKLRRQE